jgi:hypothetical protein
MKPTVIEFPAPLNAALEQLAQQTGRSPQDLIQEAVKIYLTQQKAILPLSVDMGASGRNDLSQRDEEPLWSQLPPDAQEQVLEMVRSLLPQPAAAFVPETPLAKKLWEIRQRAIANGMKLLTEEELEQELAERRGGFSEP